MTKTQTILLVAILIIVSVTSLTFLGIYVIGPAIHDRLSQQPEIEIILTATPGTVDADEGKRAIQVKIEVYGGDLSISDVNVYGLSGVEIRSSPIGGGNSIGYTIYNGGSATVFLIGDFVVGVSYSIDLVFSRTYEPTTYIEGFSHTA